MCAHVCAPLSWDADLSVCGGCTAPVHDMCLHWTSNRWLTCNCVSPFALQFVGVCKFNVLCFRQYMPNFKTSMPNFKTTQALFDGVKTVLYTAHRTPHTPTCASTPPCTASACMCIMRRRRFPMTGRSTLHGIHTICWYTYITHTNNDWS